MDPIVYVVPTSYIYIYIYIYIYHKSSWHYMIRSAWYSQWSCARHWPPERFTVIYSSAKMKERSVLPITFYLMAKSQDCPLGYYLISWHFTNEIKCHLNWWRFAFTFKMKIILKKGKTGLAPFELKCVNLFWLLSILPIRQYAKTHRKRKAPVH